MENNKLSSRVEAYFAALEAPLAELPAARREEFMVEARAHLHAMVEARRADGLNEEAAWEDALREFGEPGEVGRALWKGWTTSGQLETEGAPLSKRELVERYGWRLVAGLCVYGLLTLLQRLDPPWATPFLIGFCVFCFGFGTLRSLRGGTQWTPSNIASFVFCTAQLVLAVAQLGWGESRGLTTLFVWGNFLMLPCWLVWWWLYKRDLPKRPWKATAFYKQNAVAAEQSFRIGPLLGWTMGSLMGCVGALMTNTQFFNLTQRLCLCAVQILISVVGGLWFYRRK